jgi:hypothetical protein
MEMSAECDKVFAAFIAAQGDLGTAAKDTENPFFKSKYADLSSVWLAAQAGLKANGLAVVQNITTTEFGVECRTRVLHSSGQWLECGPLTVPLSKPDAQGVGSAITYARRYGLSATLGIVADEDDDGNVATKQGPTNKTSVTIATDSWKIIASGYRDPDAKIRAFTKKWAEMTGRASDQEELKAMQSDNMQAFGVIREKGLYDPIQMSIDENMRRLGSEGESE